MRLRTKYYLSLSFSILWCLLSIYLGFNWIIELTNVLGIFLGIFLFTGIALIPGLAVSFVNFSLLFDKRPTFDTTLDLPPISILIAAYNEEECIYNTLQTIYNQNYPSEIQVIVINDGSTDNTSDEVLNFIKLTKINTIEFVNNKHNQGKANALNEGLFRVNHDLTITIDADSTLHKDALINLVSTMVQSDQNYASVAGTILCGNSDKNFMTKIQFWDYLLGISSVKRIQSMYQGTLVAQGAFSVYKTDILRKVGGWPNLIGEDIVVTWNILSLGHKIGHSENAICFTNVPETYKAFYSQRKRWSRGLIEAFRTNYKLLFHKRKNTFFIWYNLFFPYIDFVYLFGFFPGVIAALIFKYYLIAGLLTLVQLPFALIYNLTTRIIQIKTLEKQGIKVKDNWWSFVVYLLFYQLMMVPTTLEGYVSEILKRKKVWDG